MLRVRTLYASSAGTTAAYYTQYLSGSPDDVPGVWAGRQAAALGLTGVVSAEALEAALSGRDPITGTTLGRALTDRRLSDGRVVRAVAGFDATFSAPKSLSILAALTGDRQYAECHDAAVAVVTEYLERFGATTRVRADGGRLHLDTGGLTMAAFRQATSRLDDPQLHTHVVVSAKVQTADGRWMALDARFLKQHQRALGGLYQSALRAEVGERLGLRFSPVVNGQAEIAGVPTELLEVFSKRAAQIDAVMTARVADFVAREGRDPSPFERAAMEREAAADTRGRKSGADHVTLHARRQAEAAAIGITPSALTAMVRDAARESAEVPAPTVTVAQVVEELSQRSSAWHRMDVVRAICDLGIERPGLDATRWRAALDRAVDTVLDTCMDLDPVDHSTRRASDGRSVWIEPTANRHTSTLVLAQEEAVLEFAATAGAEPSMVSDSIDRRGLDVMQADAAAAVAGANSLTVIVGPAGSGKTTMLAAAVAGLRRDGRSVFGIAPTAKAAAVLGRETGMEADTLAKLLHEWSRPDRVPEPRWRLAPGTTLIVDEAAMVSTPDLARLTQLTRREQWRLVLVGDARQLQAVGRGGLFGEIARVVSPIELDTVHRFVNAWEADASLRLRRGDPTVFDVYEDYGRIRPGGWGEHLDTIARTWRECHRAGQALAISVTTNDHAGAVNVHVQAERLRAGELDPARSGVARDGTRVYVGDVVATRHNLRGVVTDVGEMVRNRDRWTVTRISDDGALTLSRLGQPGVVELPHQLANQVVELAYAVTEYGNQGDTCPAAVALVAPGTSARGLYVAMTRGRQENVALVVTGTHDPGDARDVLEGILAVERVDVPATVQRRHLAAAQPVRALPTPPAPRRVTRAAVPDWFSTVRADAIADLASVRSELHAVTDGARQRRAELAAARDRARDARVAYEPHSANIAAARTTLAAATRRRDELIGRVAQTRFRARRDAKAELAVAETELTAAQAALDDARALAAPVNQQRRHAEQTVAYLENTEHGLDLLDSYHPAHQQIPYLERRIATLDAWQAWATGHPMSRHDINQLHHDLQHGLQHDWRREDPTAHLADALTHWATQTGVTLEPPRLDAREPDRSFGIDL